MKIRTIKLREAHKNNNGSSSHCSILWDHEAQHIVTSSSSDSSISIHDPLLPSQTPKIIRHHRDGVTALALSPNSTCLASGSVDHSVKLYKFPAGEFQTNITRFTLPIRALAFNKSGCMLAAAGDDEGIKLIDTIDGSIARVLKGHKGSINGLGFDPNGEYLASVDSIGTVIFWELSSGRMLHDLKGIAPNTGSDVSILNVLGWSPDGEVLAVPGLRNDVVMYDRDTAENLFSLRGDHSEPVCFMSWSPNGKYIATSSLDKQVLIWNVDQKQDIGRLKFDRLKFDENICCMAWKPIGNVLAVIDVMGKYGVWDSVIPSSMKTPTEDLPSSQSKKFNGLVYCEADDEEDEPSVSGSLSDLGEDSFGETEPHSRKRLRKQSTLDEYLDEDDDGLDLIPKVQSRKKTHRVLKESVDSENQGVGNLITPGKLKMQEAFQSGVTPVQSGKRRFLCYNILGSITTMEHDGYSHIEVDFHDTSRGPRVPSMTDYFGFTMASLNENGSVFANPCKGEKNMSTLMYRPFSTWANNSEWSMRFEGEEVKAVALGSSWVAAATNLNYLRIFTEGGLQTSVIALDGPVVTASGYKDELVVVYHASPLPSNDQMLKFRVINIANGTQPLRGYLPLTPGSCLTWLGFSEDGQLSCYDSKGVLKVFTNQYGGSWHPLFSPNKDKSDENYWVVGLNASKIFCIVCKHPDPYPQVMPKPILTLLDLSFPIASSDLGAEGLEKEFILNNMHLSQIQKKIEERAAAGLDTSPLDDDAFNVEAAQDRCILRLIASCCHGDKLVRATELMKLLILEKSVKGAIKLVTALKLPNLAERFNSILEERLLSETKEKSLVLPPARSNIDASPIPADVSLSKFSTFTEKPKTSDPPKLTSPLFRKKAKMQETFMSKKDSEKCTPEKNGDDKNLEVVKKNVKNVGETKKVGEENILGSSHRTLNPFARSSNNLSNSSVADSLKKLNKIDNTGKK